MSSSIEITLHSTSSEIVEIPLEFPYLVNTSISIYCPHFIVFSVVVYYGFGLFYIGGKPTKRKQNILEMLKSHTVILAPSFYDISKSMYMYTPLFKIYVTAISLVFLPSINKHLVTYNLNVD